MDYADEHPGAEVRLIYYCASRANLADSLLQVIGVDLSPIQPSL
jgi:hypothetical protein